MSRNALEPIRQDLAFPVRLMTKEPAFTVVAVLTLGLGIGASTAIFSQINAVFWKPLPVANPHELRSLSWSARRPPFVGGMNVNRRPDARRNRLVRIVFVSGLQDDARWLDELLEPRVLG